MPRSHSLVDWHRPDVPNLAEQLELFSFRLSAGIKPFGVGGRMEKMRARKTRPKMGRNTLHFGGMISVKIRTCDHDGYAVKLKQIMREYV